MKYIDLHRHIDGSITLEIAKALAKMQDMELPPDPALRVSPRCHSLREFLDCFALPVSLMQREDTVREAVRLVAEDARKEGIVYLELRFAPQLHCSRGLNQRQVIEAALAGIRESTLHTNLILCCMRGTGNEPANEETVQLAREFLVEDGGVVAIDLAGAEALIPTQNYQHLFSLARDIPFTLHAGEADGAESVRLAIDYGAKRIGHGVRIREDERVMEYARDKGIFLELCPSSNLLTGAVPDLDTYPLKDYLQYGLKVTLNTDDPAIIGTDMEKEYSCLNLSKVQENRLLFNAIEGAFTTLAVKNSLCLQFGEKILNP